MHQTLTAEYRTEGLEVPVHYGQEKVGSMNVSLIDYFWCIRYKWYYTPDGYVYRNSNLKGPDGVRCCRRVYAHRQILGLWFGDEREGHHKNHTRDDNRRTNLEIVTRQENMQLRRC